MSAPRGTGRSRGLLAWLDGAAFWPLWFAVRTAMRFFLRMRIEGPLPPRGACVLAANHISLLDPLVLGAALPRRIVFLMTATVYRSRSLGWFFRWNRAIPVSTRGGNREALRAARAALADGRPVGIFPEGGLSRDGLPMLGSPGAVALVLAGRVPIVPIGLVGTNDVLPFAGRGLRLRRIVVRFGEPIAAGDLVLPGADRRQQLQAATRTIMERIAALSGHRPRHSELAEHGIASAARQV